MKVGIIGLPSTGKSTLFSLLTGAPTPAPGGRPEPRVGIARVPDPRVEALAGLYHPKKKTPATVEYVDVPGVTKGEGSALLAAILLEACRTRPGRDPQSSRPAMPSNLICLPYLTSS